MEAIAVVLAIYLFLVLVVFPIWVIIKISGQNRDTRALNESTHELEAEINRLREALKTTAAGTPPWSPEAAPVPPQPLQPLVPPTVTAPAWVPPAPAPVEVPPPLPSAPLLPPVAAVSPPTEPDVIPAPPILAPSTPPPLLPGPAPRSSRPAINWEIFLGAKLFAWLGGVALFLGVAFFVKYSFEHDLIPPIVRVSIGFLTGAALIVGGLKIPRERYFTTVQTLIGAGVVSLYAVTFACNSIYHFPFFSPIATFLLMTLITGTAFVLAVRLDAPVVAILGILGGFLTPILLSTGHDNPAGLFGYLALLDLGLIAVALHRRWFYLLPLGAGGTVVMMLGWAKKFYAPEKMPVAMAVCLSYCALFLIAREAARRLGRWSPLFTQVAAGMALVAFGFAAYFLSDGGVGTQYPLFFVYVFLVSVVAFILAWTEENGVFLTVSAGITVLLMAVWAGRIFSPEQAPAIMAICVIFSAIYFVVYLAARHLTLATPTVLWSAVMIPAVSLGFAFAFLDSAPVSLRPGRLFLFILVSDVLLLALVWLDERLRKLHFVAGLAVFGLLAVWTEQHLTESLLRWALAAYLVFGALHTIFPQFLERRRPSAGATWWSQLFPPLSLVLMLIPLVKLETVSFILWPAILLVDVLAVIIAAVTASLAALAAVLVLTLVATAAVVFKVPATLAVEPSLLLVIGGFAVFFFVVSAWLVRRLGLKLPQAGAGKLAAVFGDTRAQLPAFSSVLPFLLLIMVCARLAVPDPSGVFGLGLLLVVLTLGVARLMVIAWLPACALAGIAAVEFAWFSRHFREDEATLPLAWFLGFYAIFAVYPFLFRRRFQSLTGPWAVAALSGVAHFYVVYEAIKMTWPNEFLGAIPAAFAFAPLVSLVVILRTTAADAPGRLNQLAWFGGVALFFITLIFPIQFERQWLTVAWALEGAALVWLFHRVPHSGLRLVGVVLLITAFVRLALNPAVFAYHVRGPIPIFNWYLYAYGLSTLALFMAAHLLAPPRERVLRLPAPPMLNTLGVILAFLLLNIEIADYFTEPGSHSLAFQFSGNFARDMSYTIGWAFFALALLVAGIWAQARAARYAAIALLSVALLKLFFHDLAQLAQLYRIGALMAVAVIAILASFAYQRFLPSNEKTPPPA